MATGVQLSIRSCARLKSKALEALPVPGQEARALPESSDGGLPYFSVAEIMDTPIGTVMSNIEAASIADV